MLQTAAGVLEKTMLYIDDMRAEKKAAETGEF